MTDPHLSSESYKARRQVILDKIGKDVVAVVAGGPADDGRPLQNVQLNDKGEEIVNIPEDLDPKTNKVQMDEGGPKVTQNEQPCLTSSRRPVDVRQAARPGRNSMRWRWGSPSAPNIGSGSGTGALALRRRQVRNEAHTV